MSNDTQEVSVSRREFYSRVWSTPISQLARQCGMSDVGLRKFCMSIDVPVPPRGYWAKKRAGKPARRTPLPRPEDTTSDPITFFILPPEKQGPKEQAQVLKKLQREIEPANRIKVSETLDSLNPLVALTREKLLSAKPETNGLLTVRNKQCLDVKVGRENVDRAIWIMNALLPALEERGYPVKVDRKSEQTTVTVDGEQLAFRLAEELERRERTLSAAEAKEVAVWGYGRDRPRHEYVLTGRLSLIITTGQGLGIRRVWCDTGNRALEDMLNAFIRSLVRMPEALKEDRLRAEQRRIEWEEGRKRLQIMEEQRRREEEERRQDEARFEELQKVVVKWRVSRDITEFIECIEDSFRQHSRAIDPEGTLGRWLSWARGRARELDTAFHIVDQSLKSKEDKPPDPRASH